ncbi:VpaChn25_0724 family phage protein [Treponema denticola]|uniref:VpaChn25_0724 family phage protein n=1 Tax=Treponema denticola TaxID=158 RepID=UPI0020A3BD42|nr:hypothetical protein [Treponema denticola]UTC87868.1 CtsR family transcriptional regulator [Treponema denticola]
MENIFLPNQRILILQGLEKDAGRTLSNEMLQRLLRSYGHSVSLQDVNSLISWLERRGYVITERLADKALVLATVTRAGLDVALGYTRADGIDPPFTE